MALERFIAKWCLPGSKPEPVDASALDRVEAHFDGRLPDDYRAETIRYGLPRPTASLLTSIVEAGLDMADASDFWSPGDIVRQTEGSRSGGMDRDLMTFAADCCGNLFCFKLQQDVPRPPQAPVWLFDHDLMRTTEVAPSFTAWLEQFDAVPFVDFRDVRD